MLRSSLKKSSFMVGMVKAAREIPRDFQRARWVAERGRKVDEYLATNDTKKLQIGAGKNGLPGWLNTDYSPRDGGSLFLDASQPFPFADGVFDCVYSEHVIEHLVYKDGATMLRESHRVLKRGGRIRIATPNLRRITSLLEKPLDDIRRRYIKLATDEHAPENTDYQPSVVVNGFFWDFGHYFVYDPETLGRAFELAGFSGVRQTEVGESEDQNLRNLESHGNIIGDEMNRFETMVFEAVKT
jgi:predicted SAM-dependent methyltransferase